MQNITLFKILQPPWWLFLQHALARVKEGGGISLRGALQLRGDEGSYLSKWYAVVFMNLQNNRDSV